VDSREHLGHREHIAINKKEVRLDKAVDLDKEASQTVLSQDMAAGLDIMADILEYCEEELLGSQGKLEHHLVVASELGEEVNDL